MCTKWMSGVGTRYKRAPSGELDTLPKNYVSECERMLSPKEMSQKREVEQDDENGFALFPNPSNGNFTFAYQLNELETGEIQVFDLIGKQVFARTLNSESKTTEVDLSRLNSGVYLIRLDVDNETRFSERISILK